MNEQRAQQPVQDVEASRKERAKARRAVVASRIRQASDALAAADLLLGLNVSLASVGRRDPR